MTLVIGSVQLTITRIQPRAKGERIQREIEQRLLEQQVEAIRQEVYRHMALSPYGIACQ